MMLFICIFCYLNLFFRPAIFKFKKVISSPFHNFRLFSSMLLLNTTFANILRRINQGQFLQVTFKVGFRLVPFVPSSDFCLMQILNQLSFQYLLLFLLPALFKVSPSKFFLYISYLINDCVLFTYNELWRLELISF